MIKLSRDDEEDEKSESPEGSPSSVTQSGTQHGHKKREKSLGQLCMQFINLFVQRSQELSLEQAASMLSCNTLPEYHKIKTKV